MATAVAVGVGLYRPPSEPDLEVRIEPSGDAVFLVSRNDEFWHGWTISCPMPLRGCVARAPGAVLRLDSEARPWLATATSPRAVFFIGESSTRHDASALLTAPLPVATITRLSRSGGRLLVEEPGGKTRAIETAGLATVVRYLAWLQSDVGRGLRDARLWPEGGPFNLNDADETTREVYRVLLLRDAAAKKALLPDVEGSPDLG
jgi:hypothetical protein